MIIKDPVANMQRVSNQNVCRWEPGSYGYNGMDGKRLHKSASASRDVEEYAEPFTAGDVVGAGIILGRQELFFTYAYPHHAAPD